LSYSSNTVFLQKKKLDPTRLTIVSFMNKDMFKDVFDDLEGRYNFQKTIHPHITMLGLFDEKYFIKISQLKLLYKHIDIIDKYNALKIF